MHSTSLLCLLLLLPTASFLLCPICRRSLYLDRVSSGISSKYGIYLQSSESSEEEMLEEVEIEDEIEEVYGTKFFGGAAEKDLYVDDDIE